MSLADYVAKKYLTADSSSDKRTKKRKRKGNKTAHEGLLIADDDALGWNPDGQEDDADDRPLTINAQSAEFRRAKKNAWQTVGVPAPSSSDQAAADAIITAAVAEKAALDAADDAAPAIDGEGIRKMESGAHAGLQTADQVTAAMKKRQAEERARFLTDGDEHSGRGKETIYRDASGRIVSLALKKAEARQKLREEEAKMEADKEAQKGAVQLQQREQRREQLRDAKYMGVARYADDEEMNDELKERGRWNDPAAGFLESKISRKSVTGRPLYKGGWAPNRYGIRPGHRWDGVDRGTGSEKKRLEKLNEKKSHRELEYAWQMDE